MRSGIFVDSSNALALTSFLATLPTSLCGGAVIVAPFLFFLLTHLNYTGVARHSSLWQEGAAAVTLTDALSQ